MNSTIKESILAVVLGLVATTIIVKSTYWVKKPIPFHYTVHLLEKH